ncbi:MAG: tRNA glutamyl-Q(34) synthetase GluQRS [Clostridia bacterium]|nr:tRNA glutamyl-Q(34) synthetase GluQRS [Clostridia bacterium]
MGERIKGRFAPSPSGRMHLGNVFCALIAWLSAKSAGGEMLLRIEDLDTARCKEEYTQMLLDDLRYLGLTFDEGEGVGGASAPYQQSKRTEYYEAVLARLRETGNVYPCFCSRDELHAASAPHATDGRVLYAGTCRSLTAEEIAEKSAIRSPALRLHTPDDTVAFDDRHFGRITGALQSEWGDFILRRSDGLFAYQLAVTADDAAMGVREVVRGRDLLSSTIPQLYLYRLLGVTPPQFAHVPLLLSADGRRLSKRDRDLDMGALRCRYKTPEPLIGKLLCLAGLLDREEALSAEEALSVFSWDRLRTEDIVVLPSVLS